MDNKPSMFQDEDFQVLGPLMKDWYHLHVSLDGMLDRDEECIRPAFRGFWKQVREMGFDASTLPASLSGYSPAHQQSGDDPVVHRWKDTTGNSPFYVAVKYDADPALKDAFLSYADYDPEHYQSPQYMKELAAFLGEKMVVLAEDYAANSATRCKEKNLVNQFAKQMKDYAVKTDAMVDAYMDYAQQQRNKPQSMFG